MNTFLRICLVLAFLAVTMTVLTVIEFRENEMFLSDQTQTPPTLDLPTVDQQKE